jgi:hypothetical protein
MIVLSDKTEHLLKLRPVRRYSGNNIRKRSIEFQAVELAIRDLFFARNPDISYFLSIHVKPLT